MAIAQPQATPSETLSGRIYNFLEYPATTPAKLFQALIYLLIIVSIAITVVEFWNQSLYNRHAVLFQYADYLILGVFTAEYVAKLAAAPKRLRFLVRPMSIVDFLAIAPALVSLALPLVANTTQLRILRFLRLLRAARTLRVLRLLRIEFFGKFLRYNNTVLQAITPILVLFALLKAGVWVLEWLGFWFSDVNLGELFAIIGFALGIILAQKVAATYDKFLQVEEEVVRLTATLYALADIVERVQPGKADPVIRQWAAAFQAALHNPKAEMLDMQEANRKLHNLLAECESGPAELAMKYASLMESVGHLLYKKNQRTPRPYDSLLQQATVTYLIMLVSFIPGWTGMLSVIVAAYVLYGMYNLTQDLDSILGGEFRLISINTAALQRFAAAKDAEEGPVISAAGQ